MHPSIKVSICHQVTSLSINPSVCHVTSPSVDPSVCHVTSLSINMSVSHVTCPSIPHPAFSLSDHPSMPDHLYAILPSLSDHPSMSDCLSTIFTSPSDCPSTPNSLYDNLTSLSDCLSPSDHLTEATTHLSTCPSSNMTQCLHDSSQSLAAMNGEQSHKAKKFCRALTNYDLLLCALDVTSIYTSVSRHAAPHKSGEDAHITHGMGDLGGPTLN